VTKELTNEMIEAGTSCGTTCYGCINNGTGRAECTKMFARALQTVKKVWDNAPEDAVEANITFFRETNGRYPLVMTGHKIIYTRKLSTPKSKEWLIAAEICSNIKDEIEKLKLITKIEEALIKGRNE